MNILNDFRCFPINMCTIIIFVFNLDSWVLKLANIDASCSSELMQELSQLLEIIRQIMAFL